PPSAGQPRGWPPALRGARGRGKKGSGTPPRTSAQRCDGSSKTSVEEQAYLATKARKRETSFGGESLYTLAVVTRSSGGSRMTSNRILTVALCAVASAVVLAQGDAPRLPPAPRN